MPLAVTGVIRVDDFDHLATLAERDRAAGVLNDQQRAHRFAAWRFAFAFACSRS